MPIGCHFRDCKALLVTSLTHVSGVVTSIQTFTFTFSYMPFDNRLSRFCRFSYIFFLLCMYILSLFTIEYIVLSLNMTNVPSRFSLTELQLLKSAPVDLQPSYKDINKCVSKTHIDKRGSAVKTMCNTLAPFSRAAFPSLIVCLF